MRLMLAGLGVVLALPVQAQEAVDTAGMRAAAAEFLAGCEAGAGLWRQSLCGPLLIVDRESRFAIATRQPAAAEFQPDGALFAGIVPADVQLANTAREWGGERWSFVLAPLPRDSAARRTLIFHEAFHRIQPVLGLGGLDRLNPHLDERDGRYWLRLELRALAAAVGSGGAKARAAVRDALLFRAVRQREFPGADTLEAALERAEGLAEYTGARMALTGPASHLAQSSAARAFEQRPSYARALGYGTGPLLGFLLDRYRPDWRTRIGREGFAAQLATALGWQAPPDPATQAAWRAPRYGGAAVAREEDGRVAARAALKEDYRRRLSQGPVVLLRTRQLHLSFDPNAVVPLDSLGTVYPTGSFTGEWGRLEVAEGGALVSPMFNEVRVPMGAPLPATDGTVAGRGWTLTLTPGWKLAPGDRPGDSSPVEGP